MKSSLNFQRVGFFLPLFLLCFFILSFFPSLFASTSSGEKGLLPQNLSVSELIEKMDDPNWTVREEATRRLEKDLMKALPLLKKALCHASPEVRWRAEFLIMSSLDHSVYLLLQKLPSSGGYGYYEGQFDDLKDKRELLVLGIREILQDEDFLDRILSSSASEHAFAISQKIGNQKELFKTKLRYLSILASGDLKLEGVKDLLIKIHESPSSSPQEVDFVATAACSLARMGEKKYLEAMIQKLEKKLHGNLGDVPVYRDLAHLYHNMRDYDKTVECYKKSIKIMEDNKESPEAIQYYNMACAYAMGKKKKEALEALQKSVDLGYRDYQWMLLDGDLGFIKKTPEFEGIIEKLKRPYSGIILQNQPRIQPRIYPSSPQLRPYYKSGNTPKIPEQKKQEGKKKK